MFNSKQTQLMNILGIVSDKDRYNTYEAYCECAAEMACEGINAGSFTDYLEYKIKIAEFNAKRNAAKTLKQMA